MHSDFKPCNLLYSKGKEVVVLDFEFAHAGHPLLDFAILLRHKETIPLDLNILEKSYRDCGGELPLDWVPRAEVTDFVNFTTMMESPLERPKLLDLFKIKINNLIKNTK